MPNYLEQSILLTIIYYDVLDKPLTAFEIWRYVIKPRALRNEESKMKNEKLSGFSLYDVIYALNNSEYLKDKITQKNGFYFLRYRNEKIFDDAIKTEKICAKKIKKIRRYIKLIKYLPFTRAIFLSGSVAVGNATNQSDLDVLIVTESKKIWLARFLVVLITFLLGIKRSSDKPKYYKDKICLNHFITTQSLKIPFKSIYTAQAYARLMPLYDEDNYFQKFFLENSWLKDYLINYELFLIKNDKDKIPLIKKIFELAFEIVNLIFGGIIKKVQIWHIKRNPLTYKIGGRVTFNDLMLEFHPDSEEKEIIKKFNEILLKFNLDKKNLEKDSGLKK